MYENLQKYKCGGCGNEAYYLYQEKENRQIIIAECTKCKSQTEVTIRPAEIELKWGKNGDGKMSIY